MSPDSPRATESTTANVRKWSRTAQQLISVHEHRYIIGIDKIGVYFITKKEPKTFCLIHTLSLVSCYSLQFLLLHMRLLCYNIVTSSLANHNFSIHWIQKSGTAMIRRPRQFNWESLSPCRSTDTILEVYVEAEVPLTGIKEKVEVAGIITIHDDVTV